MKPNKTLSKKIAESITVGAVLFVLLQFILYFAVKYHKFDIPFAEFFLVSAASVIFFAYISYFLITKEIYETLGAEPIDINRVMFEKLSGGVDFFETDTGAKKGLLSKLLSIVEDVRNREQRLNEEIEKSIALINRQNQELMFKTRASAMGEMIANIAHQWRQPLNIISIMVSDIKFGVELGDTNQDRIIGICNDINKQIKYLSNTIDDFRNFFNPTSAPKKFNVLSPVHYALSLIKTDLNKHNIEANIYCNQKCSLDGGVCSQAECKTDVFINGYKNELVQVYMNLLKNAKDVLVDKKVEKPEIKIYFEVNNKNVDIYFEDNGGGIEESILPKIFDPYFTTKHSGAGTGIGLYMCKQIIEQHHNGKIIAKNSDRGAVFCIELPICQDNGKVGGGFKE